VDRAAATGRGQHHLPVAQRDYVPGRDGADDEGGAGPGDRGGSELGVVVIEDFRGDAFRGCAWRVGRGCRGVVGIWDRLGVKVVENHDGGALDWLFDRDGGGVLDSG